MSSTVREPTVAPIPAAAGAAAAPVAQGRWRMPLLMLMLLALIVAGTYAFAWTRAAALTDQYVRDADQNYDSGNYLTALVGGEKFDQAKNDYVTTGGYLQVENIWKDPYAWPVPAGVDRARGRIDQIINQRLTIEDAENFVQANTGKRNPYMAEIYLRLGELYEQEGDYTNAKDVYESIPDLFPNRPDLVQQAEAHLDRVEQKGG